MIEPVHKRLARRYPGHFGSADPASVLDRASERVTRVIAEVDGEVDMASAVLARELVACAEPLPLDSCSALLATVILLLDTVDRGSTRMPLRFEDWVDAPAWWTEPVVERARAALELPEVAGIVGPPDADKPLVREGEWLYLHRTWIDEVRLSEVFLDMLARPLGAIGSDASDADLTRALDILAAAPMQLAPEQEYAVLTAVHAPLCVISGGPGTGKTSIVVALLRLVMELGLDSAEIALAAPTGKAAHRMAESLAERAATFAAATPLERQWFRRVPAPSTLHRLLGYLPRERQFRFGEHRPLPHALVVVDEASMVDLELMERLGRALAPHSRLVLLGDADQLPSVEAGAVLRDLIPDTPSHDAPWRALVRQPAAAPDATDSDAERRGTEADPEGDLEADPEGDLEGESVDAGPAALFDDTELDALSEPPAPAPHPLAQNAVRLSHSFRMDAADPAGGHILRVARRIVAGQVEVVGDGARTDAPQPEDDTILVRSHVVDATFAGVERVPAESASFGLILDRWLATRVTGGGAWWEAVGRVYQVVDGALLAPDRARLDGLLAHADASRILALLRRSPRGVDAINRHIHGELLRRHRFERAPAFLPGEPIMMLRNDYRRQLFNGDTGIVLRVALDGEASHRLMAAFPRAGGEVSIHHLDALRADLELAHAITVHKSQGSEYRDVLLVLPDADHPLLTRELVYTAVTRSKKSVVICGERSVLEGAIARRVERYGGVAARLRAGVETPF